MTAETVSPPRLWDPLVRLTHWGIALAILLNGLLIEDDSQAHIVIGYTALALLILRLLWGLIGSPEARFSAFPPSLRAARLHLAEIAQGRVASHRSHNPLGALMAYAFWAGLAVVSATGLMLDSETATDPRPALMAVQEDDDDDEHETHDEDDRHEAVEAVHEVAADLLLALAVLHVGGIAFETRRTGRNLVRPMTWRQSGPPQA